MGDDELEHPLVRVRTVIALPREQRCGEVGPEDDDGPFAAQGISRIQARASDAGPRLRGHVAAQHHREYSPSGQLDVTPPGMRAESTSVLETGEQDGRLRRIEALVLQVHA